VKNIHISRLRAGLHLFGEYLLLNLKAGMEYRVSFFTQVFGMMLNNISFIFIWSFILMRVGGDVNGYGFSEIMMLWSITAVGFGLTDALFGNVFGLSRLIYQGDLDTFLLQPKPVLFQVLISRSSISGWGDVLYGLMLFLFTQELALLNLLLFAFFSILSSLGFAAVAVVYNSLSFWFGKAEEPAALVQEAMLSTSLYPPSIFRQAVKLVLMSAIPSFWFIIFPARLVVSFDAGLFFTVLALDAILMSIAVIVFYLGLKKYESGNRIGARI
jgi:ABC-2 type transport system permease protein